MKKAKKKTHRVDYDRDQQREAEMTGDEMRSSGSCKVVEIRGGGGGCWCCKGSIGVR